MQEGAEFTGRNQLKKHTPDIDELIGIIDFSPIPQFVIDKDHQVVHWNKALEKYSNIKSSEVIATDKHWKAFYNEKRPCMVDLLVEEDFESIPQWFPNNRRSELVEGSYEAENFFSNLGVTGKYFHFTSSTIVNDNGEIIGGLESFEDITERKLAVRDLKESEKKFRSLIENLNVGVYRNTPDLEGHFIQVNPALARMFEYESTQEIMKINISDLYMNPLKRKEFLEEINKQGSVTGNELQLKKKNNAPLWVSVSAQAHYTDDGSIDWIDGIVEDITHRKIAEEKLTKSEKRYRSIVENINDGFCIHDFKGTIHDCNENFALMFDSTPRTIIGSNLNDLSSPPISGEKYSRITKLKKTGTIEFDADFKNKNGDNSYYNIKSTVVSNKGDGRVQSFFRDVTKRRKMEEILQESENKAQKRLAEIEAIYNSAPIGLCVLDSELRYVRINDLMAEFNGFSPEKHIGKTINELLPDLSTQAEDAAREVFQSGEKIFDREFNGLTAAQPGVLRTWIEQWYPLKDSTNNVIGVNVAALEITDMKKAEETLKKSEEKLRLAIEGADAGMWFWDLEKGLMEWTDRSKNIFGIEPQMKLTYDIFLSAVHPDDRDAVDEATGRTLNDGDEFKVEMRTVWPDGSIHWVYSLGRVFYDVQDTAKEMIGIAIDITDAKMAEQELKETLKQLKRSNAELEQFAYVASHDLQEPLRMITSFLQLLQRRYEHKLDSDANEFIQFAVDGAARMQELVNDLLAYSRIERSTGAFEEVNTEEILKQIIFDSKVLVEEHNANISYDHLPVVKADYPQLVQVFQNLINNSIKYNAQDQPRVHVSAIKNDNDWIFKIEDNGIGIDPAHGDRIFKIFQRLHARNEYEGTGIGLAIAKRIVERHGGMIWYDSNPGEGSIFYFNLPQEEVLL